MHTFEANFLKKNMDTFRITKKIGNSLVTITPQVLPQHFEKVDSFFVEASCSPAYNQGDKKLMQEVCQVLSSLSDSKVEIKTLNVISNISTQGINADVNNICFQVITPLCSLWHQ